MARLTSRSRWPAICPCLDAPERRYVRSRRLRGKPRLDGRKRRFPMAADLFFSRTGMDRARVQAKVDEALKGADDGELFLEYPPERIVLLRRRPAEGGQFRHHPGLRPALGGGRGDRLCPRQRTLRRRHRPRRRNRARRGRGPFGRRGGRSRPHQREALHRHRSARQRGLREEGRSCSRR